MVAETLMLKAMVYRLYPSKSQQRGLDQTLETCRRWYNCCLAERKDENAARNILRLGQSRWASTSTLVEVAQEAAPL